VSSLSSSTRIEIADVLIRFLPKPTSLSSSTTPTLGAPRTHEMEKTLLLFDAEGSDSKALDGRETAQLKVGGKFRRLPLSRLVLTGLSLQA
jgi:hypothetical protein